MHYYQTYAVLFNSCLTFNFEISEDVALEVNVYIITAISALKMSKISDVAAKEVNTLYNYTIECILIWQNVYLKLQLALAL